MTPEQHKNLLRTAFDSYLLQIKNIGLEPNTSYLSYDFDFVDSRQWHLLGREMVKDELREATNRLNYWQNSLMRWHAWNNVISTHADDESWYLRREFLEALAHHCLLMPSSIRDTLNFVATNSMHQVRLSIDKSYPDHLEGDPKNPNDRHKHLTRRHKEQRLSKLICIWPQKQAFMDSLRMIDDANYRNSTSDYRNLNSHSIGPNLGVGITRAVTRSVTQATTMSEQPNGLYLPKPIPGKMSVSYEFGGTEPIDIEKARVANLDQYQRARICFKNYLDLLHAGLADIPPIKLQK